jgi:predicted dehydrogenase
MPTRREFLESLAVSTAGLTLSTSAKSYRQIISSNSRLNFAVIGLNGRGYDHLSSLNANRTAARISHVCDVDGNILRKFAEAAQKELGEPLAIEKDFRKILESKAVDAVTIATPDHWHAPMAIAALQAGKHVYLEKPCSHNPAEGEMLLQAQQKYGKLVQMGNQQRSAPHTIEIVQKIHEGLIGKPYLAKAWYSNVRKSIGTGKEIPVPAHLDWDLWQGPAPRHPYTDNIHPYNWHWFQNYGTGEALNNGTHEVDVCRWALGVDYPQRVTSSGGRYHFKDDWQFYDTLITSFEYEHKMLSWEGKSCQGMKLYGRDRGSAIMGSSGTVIVDRDGYEIFDLQGKKTGEFKVANGSPPSVMASRDPMTDAHFKNFIDAIRNGEKLNAPVSEGNVAVTMLHLSNIAWRVNRELHLDSKNGRILHDPEAMNFWSRDYEKGWAPHV